MNIRTIYIYMKFDSFQLTHEEKLIVSRQICQALVFIHSAVPPLAHLDLKPENVLVRALAH